MTSCGSCWVSTPVKRDDYFGNSTRAIAGDEHDITRRVTFDDATHECAPQSLNIFLCRLLIESKMPNKLVLKANETALRSVFNLSLRFFPSVTAHRPAIRSRMWFEAMFIERVSRHYHKLGFSSWSPWCLLWLSLICLGSSQTAALAQNNCFARHLISHNLIKEVYKQAKSGGKNVNKLYGLLIVLWDS